ncbi:MAG: ParB N-terminal domain-containing protein [Chloroflexi bacterium]|nr:ParB N-terminal domain-containing protein [Chloroflexota bacterium]
MSNEQLPRLKIVPTESLILHEECEPSRVDRLRIRLQAEGVLKNPPIVAPIPDASQYVVMDGANRVSALKELGIRHVLVQEVHYTDPGVSLTTWNHLVADIDKQDLFQAIRKIPGIALRRTDLDAARRAWLSRELLAYIVCRDFDVHAIEGGGTLEEDAALLVEMSQVYRGIATIYRVNTDDMRQLLPYYDNPAAVIIYPRYEPSDILRLALQNGKVPTGITRHVIPRRALRVNVDIRILAAEESLEQKQVWLETWIKEKLRKKEVRFYQESTYLFDE